MKYLHQFAVLTLLTLFAISATSMAAGLKRNPKHGIEKVSAEVTLQNKCTRDVKYSLNCNGKLSQGMVGKGDKVKLSLTVGTVITVDGEEFMTIADADHGQTFQVCR